MCHACLAGLTVLVLLGGCSFQSKSPERSPPIKPAG
jgi:hypothetical protein